MEYLNLNQIIIENNNCKQINEVEKFLAKQGLRFDKSAEYTVVLYDNNGIVSTGSFEGRILKHIAVDSGYKGFGITNKVVSALINEEYRRGRKHLFVYTKPNNQGIFEDLGFYKIAEVKDKVILLENNPSGINNFTEKLKKKRVNGGVISSIVVNCNPFTLGHRYLIEKASRESDAVHVFVVSEDKSVFPFDVRYKLVEQGVRHLSNVVLHKSEDYIISEATFPSYFMKRQDEVVKIHSLLDIDVFTKYIVPALGINRRYAGEEPLCQVTRTYNETMKDILPAIGVEVKELQRISAGEEIISASKVRKLMKERRFLEIKAMVPESTYDFLLSEEARAIIEKV